MTVRELYAFFDERIPKSLSCEWDNDGLMCCPDGNAPVKKILVALDVTAAVVEEAIQGGYDMILSHHPLVFRPLKALGGEDPVSKKVIRLLTSGISVMSFHTRLDAVLGGVNDVLAQKLGLVDVVPFAGEDGQAIGRIGRLPIPVSLEDFAKTVKVALGASALFVSDAGREVSRVALLGGSGGDDVLFARLAGADTYLSGELGHHHMTDAPENGMNLIAGGHFFTENPVCERLCEWAREADPTLTVTVTDSNAVKVI